MNEVPNKNMEEDFEEDEDLRLDSAFGKLMKEVFTAIDEEEKADWMQESAECSKRHKIRMNRIVRESVGGSFIPFPEVDSWHERLRSRIVVGWNGIKERLGFRKEK